MKKLFVILTVVLLFFSTLVNYKAFAEPLDIETDFEAAFKIGDTEGTSRTFKLLGEEKTMAVWELRDFLVNLGYKFAKDDEGYSPSVDRAFKDYVSTYTNKMKLAQKEFDEAAIRAQD